MLRTGAAACSSEYSLDIMIGYLMGVYTRTISLKLSDELLTASGELAQSSGVSRAEYIRQAIERMNREQTAALRRRRMAEASRRVRAESLRVNAEFAAIERDPDA